MSWFRSGRPSAFEVRPSVLVLIAGMLACVTAMSYVWVRLQVVDLGYKLGRESRLSTKLDDDNRRLRVLVESLKAPGRIERLATGPLRMVPPQVTEIRSIGGSTASVSGREAARVASAADGH
jgi:cell division protein FtsL